MTMTATGFVSVYSTANPNSINAELACCNTATFSWSSAQSACLTGIAQGSQISASSFYSKSRTCYTALYIAVGGGGGGGGGGACSGGGGGGSGASCCGYLTNVPGVSYCISAVGAGGSAGTTQNSSGGAGGATTFNGITASGGFGGLGGSGTCTGGNGGCSGSGLAGGAGDSGVAFGGGGGGGGGGCATGGATTCSGAFHYSGCGGQSCYNTPIGYIGIGGGGSGGAGSAGQSSGNLANSPANGGGRGGDPAAACGGTSGCYYGGGGGGGSNSGIAVSGGAGCQGAVFIAYFGSCRGTGGNIVCTTTCCIDSYFGLCYGQNTVHIFTSPGTFTF